MAGTFQGWNINGVLPTTLGVIYTVPALTTIYIKAGHIENNDASTQDIELRLNLASGDERGFGRAELEPGGFCRPLDDGESLVLLPGDEILGVTTSGTDTEFTFSGVSET